MDTDPQQHLTSSRVQFNSNASANKSPEFGEHKQNCAIEQGNIILT